MPVNSESLFMWVALAVWLFFGLVIGLLAWRKGFHFWPWFVNGGMVLISAIVLACMYSPKDPGLSAETRERRRRTGNEVGCWLAAAMVLLFAGRLWLAVGLLFWNAAGDQLAGLDWLKVGLDAVENTNKLELLVPWFGVLLATYGYFRGRRNMLLWLGSTTLAIEFLISAVFMGIQMNGIRFGPWIDGDDGERFLTIYRWAFDFTTAVGLLLLIAAAWRGTLPGAVGDEPPKSPSAAPAT